MRPLACTAPTSPDFDQTLNASYVPGQWWRRGAGGAVEMGCIPKPSELFWKLRGPVGTVQPAISRDPRHGLKRKKGSVRRITIIIFTIVLANS